MISQRKINMGFKALIILTMLLSFLLSFIVLWNIGSSRTLIADLSYSQGRIEKLDDETRYLMNQIAVNNIEEIKARTQIV